MSLFIGSAPRLAERHRLRCRLPSRHHAHDALLAPTSSPGVGRISFLCPPFSSPLSWSPVPHHPLRTSLRACAVAIRVARGPCGEALTPEAGKFSPRLQRVLGDS